jgi:organic radical activating enzyme
VQQALLPPLLERLRAAGRTIDFETNGTIAPSAAVDGLADLWVVSPKLANSGLPGADRLRPDALDWFARCSRAAFKFVVGAPGDVEEVRELAARHGIAPARVWLMPEGTREDDLRRSRPWVMARCLDLGMRYSDRLHVAAFGSRRGV